MLSKLETELVWLTKRVGEHESLINRLNAYFNAHHKEWSRGVLQGFVSTLDKLEDQNYFEQSRMEKIAWQIHDERERQRGNDPAFTQGLIE